MRKLVVTNSITLDGVMQAPGRPDEDLRDDFRHGGWAAAYADEVMGNAMAERISQSGPILLGRRTYEDFASVWPHAPEDNPYTAVINNCQKYVVSTSLQEPLSWQNSTLLTGDVAKAVAELKEEPGKDIAVLGSGELVQTLRKHHLIDEYVLLIHPLLLGEGRRMFTTDGVYESMQLMDVKSTTTGVIIAAYRPAKLP